MNLATLGVSLYFYPHDPLCARRLNNRQILTYMDSTASTQVTAHAATATPIQIRFRAAESTFVPVPTDSLRLPRGYLLTREKVGIGIGVPVAVGFAHDGVMVFVVCEEEAEEGGGCSGDGSGAGLWVSSAVSWAGYGASSAVCRG